MTKRDTSFLLNIKKTNIFLQFYIKFRRSGIALIGYGSMTNTSCTEGSVLAPKTNTDVRRTNKAPKVTLILFYFLNKIFIFSCNLRSGIALIGYGSMTKTPVRRGLC